MRRGAGVAAVTVLALVAAGCSGGGHGTTQVSAAGHTASGGERGRDRDRGRRGARRRRHG